MTELEKFFSNQNIKYEQIDSKSKQENMQKWRETFSINLKEKTGKWILNGFDWHSFSFKYTPCQKGFKAESQLGEVSCKKFLIVWHDHLYPSYSCEGEKNVDFGLLKSKLLDLALLDDIYLIENTFEWTFVFTHEDQCGPYFAFKADC